MRILFVLILFLTSCSASYHCRKCFDKATVKRDTIVRDTTIFVPKVVIDSVIVPNTYYLPSDTITITKDRLVIRYKKLPGDSVFIHGECLPDSVRVEIKVPVETKVSTGFSLLHIILAVLAGAGLVAILMLFKR